jgi:hypothetical protein
MRVRALVLLAALLVLLIPAPVRADAGLTETVAAAYFPRTLDVRLHSIAHARVAELAACDCLTHNGMLSGTAEVLARNFNVPTPVASAVRQWMGSPSHHAILTSTTYGRIGCAVTLANGWHYFACVLAEGPLPAGSTRGAAPPARGVAPAVVTVGPLLPDTAVAPARRYIGQDLARARLL